MADKTYKADIGINDTLRVVINDLKCVSTDDNEIIAQAIGMLEKCTEQAEVIAWLMTNVKYLKMFASETQRMYEQIMPVGGWQFVHDAAKHFNYGLEQLGVEDEE